MRNGAFRLFRLFGIDVYLHWTWLLAALYFISLSRRDYQSLGFAVAEYLTLFAIVLTHEFGHSLAARSVGGISELIVLLPFGGIAFSKPPPRPGPTFWTILAGPLVNIALLTPLWAVNLLVTTTLPVSDDLRKYLHDVQIINLILLIFNLLPIYPLDGGQLLQSLIWFVAGRGLSLIIAASIGLAGTIGLGLWAISQGIGLWTVLLLAFLGMQAWGGLRLGLMFRRVEKLPRHPGLACPACQAAPPVGAFWRCGRCGTNYDAFAQSGVCPHCGEIFNEPQCPECAVRSPLHQWRVRGPAAFPVEAVPTRSE